MILQALQRNYERLVAHGGAEISPFGYSAEKISYEIVLSTSGEIVSVNSMQVASGKKSVPRVMTVPQPEKRTVGIKSNFLWDKTSYVLGVSVTSKRADKEHDDFKRVHTEALRDSDDAGLKALLAFLSAWQPEKFVPPLFTEEMKDANFVFRLESEKSWLHERSAAREVRSSLLGGGDEETASVLAPCLVSGKIEPVARLHPAIKGVYGAQSSGASIVSFNQESFTSYGKSQGENAPVSEGAAFAYTTVLNHLLRSGEQNRQRLLMGDTSVVFWAEADDAAESELSEDLLANLWVMEDSATDAQELGALRTALEKLRLGRPLSEIDPRLKESTRIYVLGLAPNASRISVRFWFVNTLGELTQNIALHARDMHIEPVPWKQVPTPRRLAQATAPIRKNDKPKQEDVPPQLAGDLMRAMLSGARYPESLLANLVMRMRSDGEVTGIRVALCKAVLARQARLKNKFDDMEVPVSLDLESRHPAYLLGRLFAVLETVQESALGKSVNATIRDRFYGAASATPAAVFPMLLRNAQNHLSKIGKEKKGWAYKLEEAIAQIVDGLPDHFPRSFSLQEQGRFAIGYYHQSRSGFAKSGNADASTNNEANNESTEGDNE